MSDTGIRLTLVDAKEWMGGIDGKTYRREEWTIAGGEICPVWRRHAERYAQVRAAAWEPSCRFTLYVVDGKVDPHLANYGGFVWPTAWTELFMVERCGGRTTGIDITDEGLMLRAAAIDRASCADADVRLLP